MPALGVELGSIAPDFLLPDQRGGKVQLSAVLESQAVLLVFLPFAFTDVCAGELMALEARVADFNQRAVQVLAVSCDSPYSLAEFAGRLHLSFDLLSDFWPHGQVSSQYGVFLAEKGFATRGSFLIDRQRRIAWSIVHGPAEERDPQAYEVAIATLA